MPNNPLGHGYFVVVTLVIWKLFSKFSCGSQYWLYNIITREIFFNATVDLL